MKTYSLNGEWKMRNTRDEHWKSAHVPGSVFTDLLREGLMEDPFYRDNEDRALTLSYNDFEYNREFKISGDLLKHDKVFLYCEGLDTLTEIKINGELIARTNNMHRSYEFDVKDTLREGSNNIHILFFSPTRYIERVQKELPLMKRINDMVMDGFYHLRKAHSMFGWDWGPKIPDSGIWRNIGLRFFDDARLKDVYIIQNHQVDKVKLDVKISFEVWKRGEFGLEVLVTSPDDKIICRTQPIDYLNNNCTIAVGINNPELWWSNGYGKQPLYRVSVNLKKGDEILDSREIKTGLRTLSIRQENDRWGKSFEFEINGAPVFARGANYIIEDNLMSRYSRKRTERLIKDCIEAHFNCIRVWGGGIYPNDDFFDLCDEYGIIVWQDLMFACSVYPTDREFISNVEQELEDNIKRIRNHPSLGLWCGNNEVEWIVDMIEKQSFPGIQIPGDMLLLSMRQVKKMYTQLFEKVTLKIVEKYDPNRFYWPSSPSSGGKFDKPNDENRGDVHYWDVWHGMKPFSDYRNHYFRFTSEFGFQSFPGIKTIESFTIPEDRNIFSYVMEKHQKNGSANGRILTYLSETFKYPKDFESLLYTSQLLQGEAVKYGVEHWRRHRGRCMGSLYWQLNDCWPTASWASIDYYGRWKALHYYAKRFYEPILVSAADEGTKVNIYVTNDTLEDIKGVVEWKLRDNGSGVIYEDKQDVAVPSLKTKNCVTPDLKDMISNNVRNVYLEFFFNVIGECISGGTLLFVKPKHFNFLNPEIKASIDEVRDQFIISLESSAYAKSVELDLIKTDCKFSDNYFDLSSGRIKEVVIDKSSLSDELNLDEVRNQLKVRSLYDIEER
ncbi:MAG TPA: glycoside hydrolase family 2 protein [Candidatus Hydromicrobium sp.]